MKNRLFIAGIMVSAVFLAGALAGCAGSAAAKNSNSPEAKPVEAEAGNEFVIPLESNPTTGYTWVENYDATFLELVEQKYVPDETAAPAVGSGGTQYFRFKALTTGDTVLAFTYKRPWENESAGSSVFAVNIR